MNKIKGHKSALLTALFLLFAMSSCLMPELSPELYVGTLNLNVDELNINGTGIPGADEGFLVIKNSTPDQTIHFIRVKYPDGSYRIFPVNLAPGEEKTIILPKGDYEVSISEDGIYYSSKEPVTIEPESSLPGGKVLDTATHFLPPGWWKTGGRNTTDPTRPEYNPDPESRPGGGGNGPGPGGSYPSTGYLTITNNYGYPIDTVQVIYIERPEGYSGPLPVINPIPGASDPQTLTLKLDPPLMTGWSIEIPLPGGKYRIRVGYQGTNAFPIWYGNPSDIEKDIEPSGGASVELGSNGNWESEGSTDPGGTPLPENGMGYIKITNIYENSIVNVIDVYQISPDTWDPKSTGPVPITPLFKGDSYYYAVPYGTYKVRVGYYDPSKGDAEDNPNWYNPKNYTGDWWESVPTTVTVGPGQNLNELVEVPEAENGQGPGIGQNGYYLPSGHTTGFVQVKNTGSSTIWGIVVNSKASDKTFEQRHWGTRDSTNGQGVGPGETSPLIDNIAPGRKFVHVFFTLKGSTTMLDVYQEVDILADVLTIPIFYLTLSFETYPIYTFAPNISDAKKGSIQIYNGQKNSNKITEIMIANYGMGTARAIYETTIYEDAPTEFHKFVDSTTPVNSGSYSEAFQLTPGRYRVAVRKTGYNGKIDWWGNSVWVWKVVHVQAGLPVVLTFDGDYIKP
jgi:hypothetical protein